jgi:transcriptional regulator with XRE-family HTH domain
MPEWQVEKFRAAFLSRGLTQYRVSQMCGWRESRISKWMHGVGTPTMNQLFTLATILDLPMEWFCVPGLTPPDYRSDAERKVLALCREIGPDEAVRRLVVNTPRPGRTGQAPRIVATQVKPGRKNGGDDPPARR